MFEEILNRTCLSRHFACLDSPQFKNKTWLFLTLILVNFFISKIFIDSTYLINTRELEELKKRRLAAKMKKKDFGYFPDVKKKVEKQKSLFRQRTKEKIYDDFSTSIQLLEKTATSKFPSEPIRKQLGQGQSLIRVVGRLCYKIVNRFILSPLVTSCICFECSSLSVWP